MPLQTSEWMKTIDETLRAKIGNTGLTESRKSAFCMIGMFSKG